MARIHSCFSEFWLVNHQYGLSEVATVKTSTPFPSKNFFNIQPTHDGQFLMRSTVKGGCIQFEGKHEKISFATCNETLTSQHWTAEFLYEEEKLHL
ncbi:unnamed protein product [Allacma fusca]|uniref:Uncharacterized protein n=1 Tax=Allacma fusca TaxID=39272 RepID=A0A8J2PYJ0_9HEXA|nr:unnamed protein product [Allacma fusca]